MRTRLLLLTVALAALAGPASAAVLVRVDKSTQRMEVSVDGVPTYDWPVSTGVAAHDTPNVSTRPQRMEATHFSKEWDDAPMPYSMFFTNQGHAIHGSGHVKALGRPASHGCVRLSVANASKLFALVKSQGPANTRIVVEGEIPVVAVARRAPRQRTYDPYANPYGDGDGYAPPRGGYGYGQGYETYTPYGGAYGRGNSYGYDDFD